MLGKLYAAHGDSKKAIDYFVEDTSYSPKAIDYFVEDIEVVTSRLGYIVIAGWTNYCSNFVLEG